MVSQAGRGGFGYRESLSICVNIRESCQADRAFLGVKTAIHRALIMKKYIFRLAYLINLWYLSIY